MNDNTTMHSNYFTYSIPQAGGQTQVMSVPIVASNIRTVNPTVQQHFQTSNANVVTLANPKYGQNQTLTLAQPIASGSTVKMETMASISDVSQAQTMCSICGQSFKKSSSLLKHMRVHRTKNDPNPKQVTGGEFFCNICKVDYINAATFEYHIRTQHNTPQSMNCIECGCIGAIGPGTRLPFRCDDCTKTGKIEYLSDSSEYVEKPRPTARTPKKSNNNKIAPADMEQLVEIMRSGDTTGRRRKVHECDWCGRTYKHQSTLAMHKKIHTGEYKYKCEYCDKEFFLAEYYHRHLRVHTKEKPYQCDVCDKSFSQSNTLIQHKRIHTGLAYFWKHFAHFFHGFDDDFWYSV